MSSGANAAVLRIDHGDQAQQLLLAQDRHGQHRPRRVRRARLDRHHRLALQAAPGGHDHRQVGARPAGGADPRLLGRLAAVGVVQQQAAAPRPRRLHGGVQHRADQRLLVVGRRQRLAVAGQRLLQPLPLAGQLGHPDRQLARHRVQRGAQLDQLVAALGHRLAAGADDRLGAAGQVGQRLRDAVGGEQTERDQDEAEQPQGEQQAQARVLDAVVQHRLRIGGEDLGGHVLGRPLDPGALHPHLRPAHVRRRRLAVAQHRRRARPPAGRAGDLAVHGHRQVDLVGARRVDGQPQHQLLVQRHVDGDPALVADVHGGLPGRAVRRNAHPHVAALDHRMCRRRRSTAG